MPTFGAAREEIERAIAARAFPAAVIEVGTPTQPLWSASFGTLTYDPGAPATRDDTIFDLASLTKVLATAPLVMQQVERGSIALDDPISARIPCFTGDEREGVTVRDLLAHCGGLPAYLPLFQAHNGRADFERAICAAPLEYAPRSRSVYSDPGFMLLGFLLEEGSSLAARFDAMRTQIGIVDDLQFHPPETWKRRTAPTSIDPWRGRLLIGEVEDENAYALGGAAGHAGLFGTAKAVGAYARHVLQVLDGRAGAFRRETLETFVTRRTDVPGSSRALAWDTMLPTSSCGHLMSPRAFGHTGFTGTSLWIDPDRQIYVVLLTNRVHPTRENNGITAVRPAVHDAVMRAVLTM